MLKFEALPPTPGTVKLTSNGLDELYLSHGHLSYHIQTKELRKQHLESVRMLGGLAADMVIVNGASIDDTETIGIELTDQIRSGNDVRQYFATGFGQGILAHEKHTRIYPK